MRKQIGAIATLLVGLIGAGWVLAPLLRETWEVISGNDALRSDWIRVGFAALLVGAVLLVLLLVLVIWRLARTRPPGNDTWDRDRLVIGARCVVKDASYVESVLDTLWNEARTEGVPDKMARETFRRMAKALLGQCVLWVDSPATSQIDGDFPLTFRQWRDQILDIRKLIQQAIFDPINDGNIGPGQAIRTVASRCPAALARVRQLREAAELVAAQTGSL